MISFRDPTRSTWVVLYNEGTDAWMTTSVLGLGAPVCSVGRAFVLLASNQNDGDFVHFKAIRNAVKTNLIFPLVVVAHARGHELRPIGLAQLVRALSRVL